MQKYDNVAYRYWCNMFYVSVSCLLDTAVSPTKTAEQIEMPLGVWTQMSLKNHKLGGSLDPPE